MLLFQHRIKPRHSPVYNGCFAWIPNQPPVPSQGYDVGDVANSIDIRGFIGTPNNNLSYPPILLPNNNIIYYPPILRLRDRGQLLGRGMRDRGACYWAVFSRIVGTAG